MFTQGHMESLLADGYCILPGVLDRSGAAAARDSLFQAAQESERRGISTYLPSLDPNAQNVRVFNLLDLNPLFVELISHPIALEVVGYLLEDDFIISNFTANIARPGSGSMMIHSDLSLVAPEPWHSPWSMNVIWCLDDVHAANGATLHLPGSHRFQRKSELPEDMMKHMIPFEAEAGSIIAMDGRLWHTSGENRTADEDRALLFGYYSRSFIQPQWNFSENLAAETRRKLSPELRHWLGLGIHKNISPVVDPDDSL